MGELTAVLDRARAVGFLGPGPVDDHIEHARQYGRALGSAVRRFADIGAGGGVPSLPMLVADPERSAVLIDAAQKRCSFLVWAVAELGLADRVEVWWGRAEVLAREDRGRGRFDAVVARGFGPPATTLECAAPLVVDGGLVVISEPPVPRRWPASGLARFGLVQRTDVGTAAGGADDAGAIGAGAVGAGGAELGGVAVFERRGPIDDAVPRPTKQLQRGPLFAVE